MSIIFRWDITFFLKQIISISGAIFLLPSLIFAGSLQFGENTQVQYKGNLGITQWYFPKAGIVSKQPDFVSTIKGEMDFTVQTNYPVELKFNPRFSYDPDNNDRNRLLIDDLYLDYFSDTFELRTGYQIFSWKTVESISPADFLNQQDSELSFFDDEKLGEPALRIRSIISLEKEHVFEFYYFPYFTPTKMPVGKNRFSFFDPDSESTLNISNEEKDYQYDSSLERVRPQGAVRYQSTFLEDFDYNLFYFNGYNRFPLLYNSTQPNIKNHYYPLIHKAGITFQGIVENWLLKGEGVYTLYQKDVQSISGNMVRPSYFAYTIGFEYTFYSPFIQNHDIGSILELLGDTDADKNASELEGYRPFQRHIFGGLRYTFNNTTDRSILAGGMVDYKNGDIFYQIEYEERVGDHFKIGLAFFDILANDDSQFKPFEKTQRVEGELSYNF